MRIPTIILILTAALPVAALAAPADPQLQEQAWHKCLREAFAHQPAGQSRAGNERNALDECKEREDAYVAALMASRPQSGASGRGWRSRSQYPLGSAYSGASPFQ